MILGVGDSALFAVYAQRLAHCFKHYTARLHKFVIKQNLAALRAGCRGRQPLHICADSLFAAKLLSLFAAFTLYKDIEKAVQRFVLRHRFVYVTTFLFFYCLSAPLGRLAPIEALPQAPLGTLSLDPAMGFTP